MAVENSVVTDLDFVVDVEQLLYVSKEVLHVVSMTDVADYSGVETLCQKLKSADSKGITRLETVVLLLKQHFVQSATLNAVKVEVPQKNRATNFVIVNLEVLVYDFSSFNFGKVIFLTGFLVVIALSEDYGHLLSFQEDFLSFKVPLDEAKDKFFLKSCVLLKIYFGGAFH